MDGLTIALEVVLPVGSAVSSAAFVLWRVARTWEAIDKRSKEALALAEKVAEDLRTSNEEANTQWRDLERTLGRIEGAMTGQLGPPPMRGRLPSR